MAKSIKRERFEKVASARVQKIISTINLLQNCANTNNYEFSEQDVELMFSEINKSLKDAKSAYASALNKSSKTVFSFNEK